MSFNQFLSDFDMDAWFGTPTTSAAVSPRVEAAAYASPRVGHLPPYNYANANARSPIFQRNRLRSGGASASSTSPSSLHHSATQGKNKEPDTMDPSQRIPHFNPSLYDISNIPPSTDPLFSFSGFTAGLMGNSPAQGAPSASVMGLGMPSASMMPGASNSANITGGIAGGLGAGLGAMGSGLNAMGGLGLGLGGLPILGPLPAGQGPGSNLSGLYSSSGFDMIGVLARLVARPNPQISIGPVDMSCSFLVVDARKYDFPIVYASPTFEKLTAYSSNEIIGRNCRFLQAPDGHVALGSRRKYTDNSAVYHIKTHMLQGKECQASIINYRKGGQPFINLITIIPITWDSDEIAYFVGLQVDLVEQPNAILEKMKDGTYVVNYQLMNMPAYIPGGFVSEPVDEYFRDIPTAAPFPASPEVFDLIGGNADNDISKRLWNRMLLEQSDDFIHVLSLKGIFLYCSPSAQKLLEYDPEELVGRSLSVICHPSDIVPVMRELKESSNGIDTVNLVYRIRRKNTGYMWIECQGKLHLEQGKGRKCVILSGRERPVYRLIWKEVMNAALSSSSEAGASKILGDTEFWSKISCDGLYLYTTSTCTNVLGFAQEEIVGMSLYQLVRSDRTTDVTRALSQAKDGKTINMRHHMQNKKGQHVEVTSTFYPGDVAYGVGRPSFIIAQTREYADHVHGSGISSNSSQDGSGVSVGSSGSNGSSGSDSGDSTPPPGKFGLVTAEYSGEENIFEELETIRSTSWQYELHQMRLTNKKLREELEALMNSKRKKKKRSQPSGTKICAHCQRKDSPEWRKGPNRPKELCNACGLRYAKGLGSTGAGPSSDLPSV